MGGMRWIVRRRPGAHDLVEKTASNCTIAEGRYRFARLGQVRIGLRVEHGSAVARCRHPLLKLLSRDRIDGKAHIGKTVAAELRRQPAVRSGMVGLELNMCRHSRHGVDLAAELGDEEAVHDSRGGELEA